MADAIKSRAVLLSWGPPPGVRRVREEHAMIRFILRDARAAARIAACSTLLASPVVAMAQDCDQDGVSDAAEIAAPIQIAVCIDPRIADSCSGSCACEVNNVLDAMSAIGTVTTFTDATGAQIAALLAGGSIVVIPEQEAGALLDILGTGSNALRDAVLLGGKIVVYGDAGDRDARRLVPRCHDGDRCLTGAQADTCEGLHVPWTLASTATATRGSAVSSPAGAGCAITGCHAHTSAPKRSASRKGARCVRRWTMARKNGDSFAWDSRCAAPRLADSHAQRTPRNFRTIPMYGVVCIPILRIAGPPRSSWPRFARRRWSPRRHVRGRPLHHPGEARWGFICR